MCQMSQVFMKLFIRLSPMSSKAYIRQISLLDFLHYFQTRVRRNVHKRSCLLYIGKPKRRNCLYLHGRKNHSAADRASSAWFCSSSLNTAWPSGSNLGRVFLFQKKYIYMLKKLSFSYIRVKESLFSLAQK